MTPAERAKIEQRLREAEDAYHALLTGASVQTFVDQNGERVTYNTGSANRLAAYISELKRQLGRIGSAESPMRILI